MHEQTVQDKVNVVIKIIFKGKSIIAEDQMLNIFLKHKALRNVVQLLGIRNSKEVMVNELVSKNMTSTLDTIAKRRSRDGRSAHRALLIGVVEK